MKKTIFAAIVASFVLTQLVSIKAVHQESLTGIKPFSVVISAYHYIDKEKHDSWDVDIGKDIKVIDFDGQTIKITKMGILETKGNVIKCGPFLDKNMEPILMSYDDKNLGDVIEDICSTYYQLTFKCNNEVLIAYNSRTFNSSNPSGLLFTNNSTKWGRIRIIKEKILDNKVTAQFAILDGDKQYHCYEVVDGNLRLKYKLAVNPDQYDINLPMFTQMFKQYCNTFSKLKSGYLLLTKEPGVFYDAGKKQGSEPPVAFQKDGIFYISTYFFSKRFHYGVMRDKEHEYWKIIKINNPSLYELSIIELVINKDDKSSVIYNGEKKKLKYDWIDLSTEHLNYSPYLSLKEYSEMFGFKYSYRDIDKSVLMP